MERKLDRLSGEDKISEKYTRIFGEPIKYTVGVTVYEVGPDGKRNIVWEEKRITS